MMTYYNNQPFLQALAGQTAHINKQSAKSIHLSIALGVTVIGFVAALVELQRLRHERDVLKAQAASRRL